MERRLAWIAPIDPVRPSWDEHSDEKDIYQPHSPVMDMANNANPLYLPTPLERTIPVPLEISMAPICPCELGPELQKDLLTNGTHPPFATSLTHTLRTTRRVNQPAAIDMMTTANKGITVSIAPTRAVPRRERMKRVRRSPRQAAKGGVILSVHQKNLQHALQSSEKGLLTWVSTSPSRNDN